MNDLVRFLEGIEDFRDFTLDELRALAAAARPCDFDDGEEIVAEGARAEGLYFVMDGTVAVTRRGMDGRRRAIGEAAAGELLGLVGLVENTRRSASAAAVGKVRAALLPRAAFTMLYQSDAPVSIKFQMLIARQLARDARELNAALTAVLTGGDARRSGLGREDGLPDVD